MQSGLLYNYFRKFYPWISWRRALLMFATFLSVETVVLVPAYYYAEQDVLDRLGVIGKATISATFMSHSHASEWDFLLHGAVVARHSIVRGGALYRADGRLIGTFGERPSMAVEDVEGRKYIAGERRYEFVLPLEQAGLPMIVIGRLDAAELPQLVHGQLKITAVLVLAFVIVLIVTGIVVTQRRSGEKRSERELRAREKRLAGVVEHSPSAIYLKSMDGRLLMVNKEYERLNGVARDQVIGKSVHENFPADAAERMSDQDQHIFGSKTVIR